ncbi:unnamed protein product, partial [Brenthis ino]
MFDPLLYEANITPRDIIETSTFKKEMFDDEDDWLGANLRMPEEETTKVSCAGYDFNETYCKTINDRIVCGYDKNIGEVKEETIDLGNGCRIRNDRLECGYLMGPFDNPRRPPAGNDGPNYLIPMLIPTTAPASLTNKETDFSISTQTHLSSNTKTPDKILQSLTRSGKTLSQNYSILKTTLKTPPYTTTPPAPLKSSSKKSNADSRKHCVEKLDNIFCYYIKRS